MGLFDFFRAKPKQPELTYASVLSGAIPIYASFGRDVYASDAVQSAIHCVASEMKKLNPQHTRKGADDADVTGVASSVQRVLSNPNPIMTTSDFIEKVVWLLYLNYNAFVIPTYTTRKTTEGGAARTYTGLYPVQPAQVDFEENDKDELFVRLSFSNGYAATLLYEDVIHVRYKFSVDDYMGGNVYGQPDNESLLDTLDLNKSLLEGIAKTMQAGATVNGVVKYNSILDKDKTEKNLNEFNELLRKNASGFLPLDLKAEYEQVKRDIKFVDADTVKFIDEKILRFFGVPLPILTGDYSTQQFEAFYSKTLEPLIVSMSQAFTKAMFTQRERDHGNRINFYPGEMVFMTVSEKLEMVRLLGDSGTLFENEKRRAFGLAPIPELEGVRMVSLNYVNSASADEYQLNKTRNTTEERVEK